MAINKVVYDGSTLIDLSSDTVSDASHIMSGYVGHLNDGTQVTGTGSGGSSASNLVTGTFTLTESYAQSISISYTGSGYPIACVICVADGIPNNSTFYSTVQRYAIGFFSMYKSYIDETPTYSTSGTANQGTITCMYKSSTSNAKSMSRTSSLTVNTFTSAVATNSATTGVRFLSSTELSVYGATSSYGLMTGIEYRYYIIYSS